MNLITKNLLFNKNITSQLAYKATAVASQTKNENIKTYKDIPGPKSYPLVGSILSLNSFGGDLDILDIRNFQLKIQSKYGDIVRFNIFDRKNVHLFRPDLIKQVFKLDGSVPMRPSSEPFVKLQELVGVSSTLINSQGERWRRLRTASNPIMARPQSIHNYINNQNQVANELIEYINRKFVENKADRRFEYKGFDQVLRLLALEYISEIIFDKKLDCVDENKRAPELTEFVNKVEDFFVAFGLVAFALPFWKYYPTKDWKMFEDRGRYIYKFITKYIVEANEKYNKEGGNEKNSILSQYLSRREKYNLEMKDIVAIMTDFLIAGVDTTAVSIYHLMYELGLNQDIQQKLYDEINSVVKNDTNITDEHIEKLKYMKFVVKESARIHAIVPANSRILNQDLVLDDYLIPKGTFAVLANNYISQSERFYKNPLKFDPMRWEREDTDIDPYANLSFGFGARMCIGRRVAEQEIYLTIIKIIQNYRLEYHEKIPDLRLGLLATPSKPLNIIMEKRK